MIIGFTATRDGMSNRQRSQLAFVLRHLRFGTAARNEFHHGGADGGDVEGHSVAWDLDYWPHVHPAVWHDEWRALPHIDECQTYDPKPPLERDRDIASICDILIAAPRTDREVLRSGTWATVRYARAAGKPVVMLSRGVTFSPGARSVNPRNLIDATLQSMERSRQVRRADDGGWISTSV